MLLQERQIAAGDRQHIELGASFVRREEPGFHGIAGRLNLRLGIHAQQIVETEFGAIAGAVEREPVVEQCLD